MNARESLVIRKPFTRRKSVLNTGDGKTEQAHKKECDMNYILKNYQKTGLIRHSKQNIGRYDDVTKADFQEAMFLVTNAQQMFQTLPSGIRKRFHQDPAQFLEFVQNPDNKAEMQKMGILRGNDGLDAQGAPVSAPVDDTPAAE